MSGIHSTPEDSTPGASPSNPSQSQAQAPKSKRVLACVLCQQRKVKCERKFPCSNCLKANAQCVPANLLPRQRKRRFPERALLDRLRSYEDIMRQHNVKFEPMHKGSASDIKSPDTNEDESDDEAGFETANESVRLPEARSFWHAMSQGFHDTDNVVREVASRESWDQVFDDSEHILFGIKKTVIDLPSLHPDPVQLFRLWQIYLDNVDPLLKVTHTPTLQPRIIEAVTDVTKIGRVLEALMFSIYCVAILSLSESDCQSMFGADKADLSHKYRLGCQQALVNCGYLRTRDRDCVTALYLYLVSIGKITDPRSLSSMLGVAIRISQRMSMHIEAANCRLPALEAEMRRRLWWSLVLYDTRIGELADSKSNVLAPIWDCKIPQSLNDSDLRPEMKELPASENKPSEAIYAAMRSELANYFRHTGSYLDFNAPALKAVLKKENQDTRVLRKLVEEKYLKLCDPENPVHFMTIWTARSLLARFSLIDHYSKWAAAPMDPTDAQRDDAMAQAIQLLETDTKITLSPLTTGYRWMLHIYFPLPGYIHIVYDLRRRPLGPHAERAWEAMTEHCKSRISNVENFINPLFKKLSNVILLAWEARVEAYKKANEGESPLAPGIVRDIKTARALHENQEAPVTPADSNSSLDMSFSVNDFWMTMPVAFSNPNFQLGMDWQTEFGTGQTGGLNMEDEPVGFDPNMNQLNWATMGWGISDRPDPTSL